MNRLNRNLLAFALGVAFALLALQAMADDHHDRTIVVTQTVVKHDRDNEAAAALIGAGIAYWVYHRNHRTRAERVSVARINERIRAAE